MEKGNLGRSPRLRLSHPLFPGSPDRQEFVDAYVNYVFQISVGEWYTAFSSGFLKVCGGKVLELFQPSELRAMMVGNSNYNWEELEEVSRRDAHVSSRGTAAWGGGRGGPAVPRAASLSLILCDGAGSGGLARGSACVLLSTARGVQTCPVAILLL